MMMLNQLPTSTPLDPLFIEEVADAYGVDPNVVASHADSIQERVETVYDPVKDFVFSYRRPARYMGRRDRKIYFACPIDTMDEALADLELGLPQRGTAVRLALRETHRLQFIADNWERIGKITDIVDPQPSDGSNVDWDLIDELTSDDVSFDGMKEFQQENRSTNEDAVAQKETRPSVVKAENLSLDFLVLSVDSTYSI